MLDYSKDEGVSFAALVEFLAPRRILGRPVSDRFFPAPIDSAMPDNITFCAHANDRAREMLLQSQAGVILCRDDIEGLDHLAPQACLMTVEQPKRAFMAMLDRFFKAQRPVGIHPTAIIDSGASLPEQVFIGPGVHVGSNAKIGEGTIISDHVYIAPDTIIGRNVFIQPGAVIGCEGQGFERNEKGEFVKFIQLGKVVIEDNVEIGANSTLVRAALSVTRVGQGTKIGHQANIAHNVQIGRHVFISAGVVLCGSVRIGDYSWLAPQCCIRNQVSVGNNVTVGLGAVVVADVLDGLTIVGNPAKPLTK